MHRSPQETNNNLEDASDKFSLHADIPFLQKSHHRIWYIWLVIAIVGVAQNHQLLLTSAAFLRLCHSACRSLLTLLTQVSSLKHGGDDAFFSAKHCF